MDGLDWRTWSWGVWALYGVGALYVGGFVWFFARLETVARRAARGDPEAVRRHNRLLRGFPNALYARMLGRHPLEDDGAGRGMK